MKLYSEILSERASTDTLFIHGNLASTVWWQPTTQHWKNSGSKRLVLADWRGCGKNPDWTQSTAFTIEDLARDFLELMNDHEMNEIHVVGHSLGGLIALQMMIMQPERFTKAVLLDPVGAQGVVFDDSMYEAFRQMAQSFNLTRTVILSTILGQERLSEDFKQAIANDAFKAVKGIGTSVLEILKTVDLRERLSSLKIPTLILHGQEDKIIPLNDSENLVKLLPKARLEVLSDVGHCWNVEDPASFTTRIQSFLEH